jgi:uncharacterized protein (TIGR02466 family)
MDETKQSRFESSRALRMFPTFVWIAEIEPEIHQRINNDIVGKLDRIRRSMSALEAGQSWQSHHGLHKMEEFHELVSCIDDVTTTVLNFLKIGYDTYQITACWANISAPSAGHRIHCHPNNFLSGVYYATILEGADTINFHDPRIQTGIFRPPVTELTAENTDQVVVKVKTGTLLVFPSWLQHSVDANESNEERVSVSFNIMFSSFTESMSSPLWKAD